MKKLKRMFALMVSCVLMVSAVMLFGCDEENGGGDIRDYLSESQVTTMNNAIAYGQNYSGSYALKMDRDYNMTMTMNVDWYEPEDIVLKQKGAIAYDSATGKGLYATVATEEDWGDLIGDSVSYLNDYMYIFTKPNGNGYIQYVDFLGSSIKEFSSLADLKENGYKFSFGLDSGEKVETVYYADSLKAMIKNMFFVDLDNAPQDTSLKAVTDFWSAGAKKSVEVSADIMNMALTYDIQNVQVNAEGAKITFSYDLVCNLFGVSTDSSVTYDKISITLKNAVTLENDKLTEIFIGTEMDMEMTVMSYKTTSKAIDNTTYTVEYAYDSNYEPTAQQLEDLQTKIEQAEAEAQ